MPGFEQSKVQEQSTFSLEQTLQTKSPNESKKDKKKKEIMALMKSVEVQKRPNNFENQNKLMTQSANWKSLITHPGKQKIIIQGRKVYAASNSSGCKDKQLIK